MALDFISEADNKFIADNLLSSEDWGDPVLYNGEHLDDLVTTDHFNGGFEHNVLSPSHELLSDDPTSDDLTSIDLNGDLHGDLTKSWLGMADEEQLTGLNSSLAIKSEPLSPPPSSASSEASSESSQTCQILHSDESIHIKLESPPLTPPRDPSESPTGQHSYLNGFQNGVTKSLASGVINGTKKGVAIAPKPRNGVVQLPIAPKIESRTAAVPVSLQSQPTSTVTVKQIPVTVRQPVILKQNGPALSTANGSCGPPPVKQAKVIPVSHHNGIPSPTQPVAVVTQPCPPDVDVKAWKRQQRMIKNRESACLSRKKKKEYLQELECKAQDMQTEIDRLRAENRTLRNRIESLVKENASLKMMKSTVFSSPGRTATCLLAVVFVIGFNLSPLGLFSQTKVNSDYETGHHEGRALLSFSQDTSQNAPQVYGQSESRHTSLHSYLEEDLRLMKNILNGSSPAADVSVATRSPIQYLLPEGNLSCPETNVTETMRLTDVLQVWAKRQRVEQKKSEEKQQEKQKKKKRRQSPFRRYRTSPSLQVNSDERALQLYDHLFQQSYDNLLDALNRRDDTFYVVSFRKDHLLLPATAHNNTHRPKMSLVMPTMSSNESLWNTPKDHISMMQIDCEVINTRVVHIKDANSRPVVNKTSYTPPAPASASARGNQTQTQSPTAYREVDSEHKLGYHPRNLTTP